MISATKPSKIYNLIKEIIAKYTSDRTISFNKERHRDKLICALSGNQAFYAFDDRNRKNYVVSILSLKEMDFWLGMILSLKIPLSPKDQYQLIGTSLRIYQGISEISEDKDLLFRAEWEWPSEEPQNNHAQPHWQFQPRSPDASTILGRDISKVQDFGAVVMPEGKGDQNYFEFPMSRFHFAMSANWHLKDGVCQIRFTELSEFRTWLDRCIEYIQNELKDLFKIAF